MTTLDGAESLHTRATPAAGAFGRLWRELRWPARIAVVVLIALFAMATAGPWLAPHDPDAVNLAARLQGSTAAHWLGTDHLGRDMLSRIIVGAGASLGSVAIAMALIMASGLAVGGAAALMGGRVDQALMRLTDIFLTFPTLVMALFMVGALGVGLVNVIIAIVVTHWAWYARLVRGVVLSLKNRDFIAAAQLAGASRTQIFLRRLLPAVLSQLLVLATLDIGHIMLHVSSLSFIGLGVSPPTAEWGVMMSDARAHIWTSPLLMLWPGLALFVSVLALNTLGDAARDRLDPSLRAEHGH